MQFKNPLNNINKNYTIQLVYYTKNKPQSLLFANFGQLVGHRRRLQQHTPYFALLPQAY